MWNIQAHVLGYGIEEVRWFEMLHIPLAFGILLLALYLTEFARWPHFGRRWRWTNRLAADPGAALVWRVRSPISLQRQIS